MAVPVPLTSSKTGTFYFAYGSNLSPTQMSIRLAHSPRSSQPVAIARLDSHAWIICERGYANVVRVPAGTASGDDSVVWGVLYDMHAVDEARLDLFEGCNHARNPHPVPAQGAERKWKQFEQGGWDYNKHYLPLTVTTWLRDPAEYGVNASREEQSVVTGLVYVDEFRTTKGEIVFEYIGRMNRAIKESVDLGMPSAWVDKVMRQWIPKGIEVDDEGYVGTDEGYVEEERWGSVQQRVPAEATEADDHVKEKDLGT